MNKRKFIKTSILGAILGLFGTKLVAKDAPPILNGGEYVLSKDVVNKLGRADKECSMSVKELSEKIKQQVIKTIMEESRPNGILSI